MLAALQRYGEAAGFNSATRTWRRICCAHIGWRRGQRLTEVTARLAAALGLHCALLPMSDDPVATRVWTREEGELDFQTWFVRKRWQPAVRSSPAPGRH